MKLIIAILDKKDFAPVSDALKIKNFMFTEIGSTGGFLRVKNTTLLLTTEDERVDEAIGILRTHAGKRKQSFAYGSEEQASSAILIGGATVIVTDVVRFEKV